MKKNVKGITLVSMVITIIVMLILAGVSISMVTGENGVVTRASQGSIKTKVASIESDLGLAISSLQTDYMSDWTDDSSIASSKDSYFTVGTLGTPGNKPAKSNHKGMNDYLSECQVIADQTTTGTITAKDVKNAGNDVTVKGAMNSTTLYSLAGSDNVQFTLYLTDGASSKVIESDLYVAVMYMEDGVAHVVDVGLVETTGTFTQGAKTFPKNTMSKITWLDDGVNVTIPEATT